MAEVLVVELKNQPAGPPTVWLAYDVVGGLCAAEAVTVIRNTAANRFVTATAAIAAAAM